MNDVLVQVNETLGEVENVVEQLKNDPRLNTADSAGRVTTPRADFPSSLCCEDDGMCRAVGFGWVISISLVRRNPTDVKHLYDVRENFRIAH